VQLLCLTLPRQWLLVDSIAKQFNAFSKGFFSVCGGPALELFKPQELELLICGSPTLDFHALEEAALLEDGLEPPLNSLCLSCYYLPHLIFITVTSKAIRPFNCCGKCFILSTWSRRRSSCFFALVVIAHPSKALVPWFLSYRETDRIVSDCRPGR
jgi:hypothetical protein